MLRNYLTIAFRNIQRHPVHSLISMFSLAIGLAACLAIYLFVIQETSFDNFHSKRKSIFRLLETQTFDGMTAQKVAITGSPFGPGFQQEFPEVEAFTRYLYNEKTVLQKGNQKIVVKEIGTVDSTFLHIFDFPLIRGDRKTALNEPNSLVLSEKVALQFFPSIDAGFGNTITAWNKEYKITGIVQNVPGNSHLQFDALESMSTYTRKNPSLNTDWTGSSLVTYFLLRPNVDVQKMQAKFPEFLVRWSGAKDVGQHYAHALQPLTEVHLGSVDVEHDYNNYRKFNGTYVTIFTVIGIFILFIACVNFVNLTLALTSHRGKEIGIRKTIGAAKKQLLGQFIVESCLLACSAALVALFLDILLLPYLSRILGHTLAVGELLQSPRYLALITASTLVAGVLTGLYPALYMSSMKAIQVLKGVVPGGRSFLRSSLAVVQFSIALAMIVGTFIVAKQLRFMETADIGFNRDHIMILEMYKDAANKYEFLKSELLQSTYVTGVAASAHRLGGNLDQGIVNIKTENGMTPIRSNNLNVDRDYLKVYGVQLKEGRDFGNDFLSNHGKSFIVNETMVNELRLKNPVGTVAGRDSLGQIIGVVKDFKFNSLHHKVGPLVLFCNPSDMVWSYGEISIKIKGDHITDAIRSVKQIWDKNIQSSPFAYSFLDEQFDSLYRNDRQLRSIVTILAVIAILISCMGLFGLAAIAAERKTKEIGIRKVLGASVLQIAMYLSRHFVLLILLSFLVATPVTYLLLLEWLQNFAFRIALDPAFFLLGGGITMVIALLTISYHTAKSAFQNPVESIRTE